MSGLYAGLAALADESDEEVRDAITKILRQQEQRDANALQEPTRTLRRPATWRMVAHA